METVRAANHNIVAANDMGNFSVIFCLRKKIIESLEEPWRSPLGGRASNNIPEKSMPPLMKMFIHSFMLVTKINNISLLTRQTNKTYYNLSQIDQTQNTKYRNRYQTNKQTNQLKLIYIEPTTHININNIIWHFVCLCVRQRFSYICMYCGIIALRICVCVWL